MVLQGFSKDSKNFQEVIEVLKRAFQFSGPVQVLWLDGVQRVLNGLDRFEQKPGDVESRQSQAQKMKGSVNIRLRLRSLQILSLKSEAAETGSIRA